MTETDNNIESVQQNQHDQNLQENNNEIAQAIELLKKILITINGRDTEAAKELGLKIDGPSPRIDNIVRQVLGKKIWISLRQLLEIVKTEVQQEIINSISNPDISKNDVTYL
ncbi:hypothetical protein Glove_264g43 [Diversispora epigaea]|uniref:Uncharacterized protein n=1 Tax=Diversispora epigaea TaxID=1348612 RepID=A0A397I5V4_9GLOM|nr:hypothetical protein Glove_264g43 [Diversispora epigaea]